MRPASMPARKRSRIGHLVTRSSPFMEGSGNSIIGDVEIAWKPRDIFTLPDRSWIRHSADNAARLFVCTDKDVLSRLGLLFEEYGD